MFNTESVKELAHSNPTSSAVFLAFSQRERGRNVINLDLIYSQLEAEGVKLDHSDYFGTFKRLEELEIGKLVYGRKGNANCFIWSYNLKDVAKIGLGSKGVEPKETVARAPRGINKGTLVIRPKQKTVEALIPTKQRGPKKKYVHIKIPIEMLAMIKGLK